MTRLYYLISFLIFAIFIGPYFYISQYIFLSQDDFCRVFLPGNLYFSSIKYWYFNENGRYINAFLSLLPVYDLKIYRFIPVLMISSFLIGVSYFFKNLCSIFELKIPRHIVVLSGVLIIIQVFIKLPLIFEFVYWYAGVTVYFVSILLLLLLFNALMVLDFSKNRNLFIISILIILVNGNNEMALILVNFVLVLILIYGIKTKSKFLRTFIIFNIISWISSIPLLFASSSDARRSHFENGGDFIFSMVSAFSSAGSFVVKNVIAFPDTLLWLGLMALLISTGTKGKNHKLRSINIHPIILAIISFFALMSQMFVIYYAVGILEAYGGRIGNFIHVVFIILVLINIVNLTRYILSKWPRINEKIKIFHWGTLILSVFLIYNGLEGKNYTQVISDLSSGKAQKYKMNIEERLIFLKNTNKIYIEFNTIQLPRTITNFDLRTVSYWENDCFISMINRKYNKSIRSIIRLE